MKGSNTKMLDLALFADRGKGWKKLSTYENAVADNDDKEMAKVFSHFRKQAQMWSNNASSFALAQFAVFASPHGKDDFTLLKRI